MILEVAVLHVKQGQEKDFERTFEKAQQIISRMDGYVSHQLQRCLEKNNQYILLVNWQTLEAHTIGFRASREYQGWRLLLHHFYEPCPTIEHYQIIESSW
ncbi:MAG: antibiotic biosynthesis monooxygenase [Methylococcales bacterium]|nr:antibiotic biosynthesis monooxygenase [Methylococcales bacterium]